MLVWNSSVLTKDGLALLAKAQAGKTKIHITKAATGSGSYTDSEDLTDRKDLKVKKQTLSINNQEIRNASTVMLKIVISNKDLTTGYEIKEFGVYAQDPDKGEILYSIATSKTSDYMPAYNNVIPSVLTMYYYLEVSNAENVTINMAGALALATDLAALEERVVKIENLRVKKYGARRKTAASTTTWERLGDAVGLTARAAVGNGEVTNDYMKDVYPYNAVRPCNLAENVKVNAYMGENGFKWDGSNGDVMLEVPIFYSARYFETDADGVEWEYRWLSAAPVDGLHIDPMFIDGDKIVERAYIPIFNGSLDEDGTKLISRAGVYPLVSKSRPQFRTYCKNKGQRWSLDDVWSAYALQHLFIIMFANTNAQQVIGAGRTSMPYSTAEDKALQAGTNTNRITIKKSRAALYQVGQTVGIGVEQGSQSVAVGRYVTKIQDSTEVEAASDIYFDGAPVNIAVGNVVWSCAQPTGATIEMKSANGRVEGPDGRTAIRFLWIEDWYGNIWNLRDGDNIKKWQHYFCMNRASYADNVYDGDYFKLGYACPQENGYPRKMGIDKQYPMIAMCEELGGSSTTYFADYYVQSEGGTVVISGGHVGDGGSAGPFYWIGYWSASSAGWSVGGRPLAK